jgi:hypothetical protein
MKTIHLTTSIILVAASSAATVAATGITQEVRATEKAVRTELALSYLSGKAVPATTRTLPLALQQAKQKSDTPDPKKATVVDGKEANDPVTDDTKTKIADEIAGAGFGLNAGYGYFFHDKRYASHVQVRYNFYRLYTALTDAVRDTASLDATQMANLKKASPLGEFWGGSKITSMSGWIGTTPSKLKSKATTDQESPLMVGLSLGLGNLSNRASAVDINVGAALFNKPGFKRSQPFVGVSVDLEVFKALSAAVAGAFGN